MSVLQLSKNFSIEEMVKSETAVRFGIDNTPSEHIVLGLKTLVTNVLQPIRDKFGPVVVTSGYRSPAVNRATGGSATSDHCLGLAADFQVLGMDNRELALWIKANLAFKQLILEFYRQGVPDSGWVHVSYEVKNLKNEALTAVKIDGRTRYLPGIE